MKQNWKEKLHVSRNSKRNQHFKERGLVASASFASP